MTFRTIRTALIAIAAAGVFSFAYAQSVDRKTASIPEDRADLRKTVAALERRLAKLEKQVEELSAKPQILTIPAPNQTVPPTQGPELNLPPGVREHEFNGAKYYIVPLK